MAYTATYDSGDVPSIAIDFVANYGVQLVAFAGLVALAFVALYFKRHMGGRK